MPSRPLPPILALAALALLASCGRVVSAPAPAGPTGTCTAGDTQACAYTGPAGTRDVGLCKAATQTCAADGQSWGACAGEVLPAQETCADPADEDCDGHDCVETAAQYGDGGDQYAMSVATDAAGNVVVGGMLFGSIPDPGGPPIQGAGAGDGLVLKIDPAGKILWGQAIGDAARQVVRTVAVDPSGDVVAGGITDDAILVGATMIPRGLFITKLAGADGHVIWAKGLGGGACTAAVNAFAFTPSGDIAVAGDICGPIDFGDGPVPSSSPGTLDGFVALIRGSDGSGKKSDGSWGHLFGGDKSQEADGVAVDPSGAIVAVGSFQGSLGLGAPSPVSAGGYDAFVARFLPDGTLDAVRTYGDERDQWGHDLAMDGDGNLVLLGSFSGSIDFGSGPSTVTGGSPYAWMYLVELDPSWSQKWIRTFGGPGYWGSVVPPPRLARHASGDLAFASVIWGKVDFGTGLLGSSAASSATTVLVKLDATGKTRWARGFAHIGEDTPVVSFLPSGEEVMAGTLIAPTDFGAGTLIPSGNADVFVARFGI